MQKRERKKIQISQSYDEKSDFDPPSWIYPPFFASLDFLYLVYYNKTPMQKRKLKKVGRMQSSADFKFWRPFCTSDAILDLTKTFLLRKVSYQNTNRKLKTE